MAYKKGDILWVELNRRNPRTLKHPAIVWDNNFDGSSDFNGIMLTHSTPSVRFDNVLMTGDHFEDGYELTYNNTHFVNQIFTKFESWGPFYQCGRLTDVGIEFIEEHIAEFSPIEFEAYIRR